MLKIKLHYNLKAYTPEVEYVAHPETVARTLHELTEHLKEGSLSSVDIEEPDGSHYRLKPRRPH